MPTPLFLCYPSCSTCKKAQAWLDEHGVAYQLRNIAQNNPTVEELAAWLPLTNRPVKALFNTSGRVYQSLGLKDRLASLSTQEQLALLATDGMLVKRPLLVLENAVLVGFRPEQWEAALANAQSESGAPHWEIERKFALSAFPDIPCSAVSYMEQGYLCTDPVVRIRSDKSGEQTGYRLCVKGTGGLKRREIELALTQDVFEELRALLPVPLIRKELRRYPLPGGLTLECSRVDEGEPTEFFYAEVEFPTIEAANSFTPPAFLGKELTDVPNSSMSDYWERKKAGVK